MLLFIYIVAKFDIGINNKLKKYICAKLYMQIYTFLLCFYKAYGDLINNSYKGVNSILANCYFCYFLLCQIYRKGYSIIFNYKS